MEDVLPFTAEMKPPKYHPPKHLSFYLTISTLMHSIFVNILHFRIEVPHGDFVLIKQTMRRKVLLLRGAFSVCRCG